MIEKLKETGIDEVPFEDENGIAHGSKAGYLQTEYLGFCGCGNSDEVMLWVKEKLELLDNSDFQPYEDMPYMFFVYWANDKGFAEHGTTARCSWLTEKGKKLLADINTILEEQRQE